MRTAKQIADDIKANVDASYSGKSWEAFSADQRRLWDEAQGRGLRFERLVKQSLGVLR